MTGIAYPIAQDNETHRARVWRTSKRARFSNICLLGVCQCRHGNGLIMGLYAHRNQRFAPIQAEIIAVFSVRTSSALLRSFCSCCYPDEPRKPYVPRTTPCNLTLSGYQIDAVRTYRRSPTRLPLSRSQLKCEGMVARQFLFVLCKNEAAASEKAYSQSFSG